MVEKEKRSRKRSRYLSPPYTFPFPFTVTLEDAVCGCGHGSDQSEDLTNVAVPDMLSALHAAALLDMDAANVDLLRRFFTLHKTTSPSNSSSTRVNAQAESSSRRQKEEETASKTNKRMKKKKAAAASTPTSRLPLTDVRNNLEKMISSLLGRSPTATTSHDHGAKLALAGEMRGLLAKVDKMLSANRH
uniref:Uncharacterized protein n=1 Tax=Oryza punctata TaxID=4537 RepID=A0A0E0KXE9_ORYPU